MTADEILAQAKLVGFAGPNGSTSAVNEPGTEMWSVSWSRSKIEMRGLTKADAIDIARRVAAADYRWPGS